MLAYLNYINFIVINIMYFDYLKSYLDFRYFFLFIALFILVLIGIYKIKFQFWSRQPVFHIHNLKYWLVPPGIIQHRKPEKDKFYEINAKFIEMYNLNTQKKALITKFIGSHYMPHKYEKYVPTKKSIVSYFNGHNNKSYLSLMYDKTNLSKLIGMMTTRPLDIIIDNNELQLYYVDFLCVHKNERKKGIAPRVIYTHYLNHRHKHDNMIFLFKREGPVTLIVPLTIYNNYLFDVSRWSKFTTFDQPNIQTILVNSSNFNLFLDVFERLKQNNFRCFISPNINNIKVLVKSNCLFICLTMINNKPFDCYFFRNSFTSYNGNRSIELFGSFKETEKSIFLLGFFCSLSLIWKRLPYKRLFIENISDNNIIIKKVTERYSFISKTRCSYYFYNFAYRPFLPKNVFILN